MAITLDAPMSDVQSATGSVESEAAAGAVELLEGGSAEGVEESTGIADPTIKIRLRKPVEDAVQKFAALAGETFDAHVDADGDLYIKHGELRVYLESGDAEAIDEDRKVETTAAVAETTAAVVETTTTCLTFPTTSVLATPSPADLPDAGAQPSTPPENSATAAANTQPTQPVVPAVPSAPRAITPAERFDCDKLDIQEHMCNLMRRLSSLKRETASTKKAVEVATDELQDLIDSWENGKYEAGLLAEKAGDKKPPATPPEPATSAATAVPFTTASGSGVPTTTTGITLPPALQAPSTMDMTTRLAQEHRQQERYNDVLDAAMIGELGLQPKLEEKLIEAGATTLLKLERLRADIGMGREKWPKGVGEGKVTIIENALSAWLARNTNLLQVEPEPGPAVGPIAPAGSQDSPATAAGPKITLPPAASPSDPPAASPAIAPPSTVQAGPSVAPPAIKLPTTPPVEVTIDDL